MVRPLLALAAYALLLLAVPGMAGILLGGVIVARAHRWAERHKAEARAEAEAIEGRAFARVEGALELEAESATRAVELLVATARPMARRRSGGGSDP